MEMVAPGTGLPFESVTFPEMVTCALSHKVQSSIPARETMARNFPLVE
jgi:hypothetical protein